MSELETMPDDHDGIVIVPHNVPVEELTDIQGEVVTDMWVEQCLYRKVLVDRSLPLCKPFWHGSITGWSRFSDVRLACLP